MSRMRTQYALVLPDVPLLLRRVLLVELVNGVLRLPNSLLPLGS